MRYLIGGAYPYHDQTDEQSLLMVNGDKYHIKRTRMYTEICLNVDAEHSCTFNLIPRDEHSVYVAGMLEEDYSFLKDSSTPMYKWVMKYAPTVARLYADGVAKKYRNCALMEMEDADYGEMAWCITTVVGNLDSTDDVSQYQEQLSGRISSILTLMGAVMQEVRQGPSFKKFAIIDSISASVMGFMEECGKSVTDSAADEVKTMLTSKASSFINTLLNGDV